MNIDQLKSKNEPNRKRLDSLFKSLCFLIASTSVVILIILVASIFAKGGAWLDWGFLVRSHHENAPEKSGVGQAMIGSIVTCLICGAVALPVGIGTAVFLEEFKPRNRWLSWLHGLVNLNISNLAGVPSIVYGILGVTTFVYMFGIFGQIEANKPPSIEIGSDYFYQIKTLGKEWVRFPATDRFETITRVNEPIEVTTADGQSFTLNVLSKSEPRPSDPAVLSRSVYEGASASIARNNRFYYFHLPFHKSALSAGLTLALVVLPIVIIASQEAIRAVPNSLREASFGLGATPWQAVWRTVLPAATPGIITGAILSMSRAIGEAAPLLAVMGGVISTTMGMTSLMDRTPALPVTIYRWAQDENPEFMNLAAAAIIVLLGILLAINSLAILIRYRAEKWRV